MTGVNNLPDFRRLLDVIGVRRDELVAVVMIPTEKSKPTVTTHGPASNAPDRAVTWTKLTWENTYFGVCPLKPDFVPEPGKRGSTEDMDRIPALWADLDSDKGKLGSEDECREVIKVLTALLGGRQPVAVVSTGSGGLHPYWRIEDYPAENHARAAKLLKRWGLLVQGVAIERDGKTDGVYEVTRILRVPGTHNMKPGRGMKKAAVEFNDPDTEPDIITLDELEDALLDAGIREVDDVNGYSAAAESSPMKDWPESTKKCHVTAKMVASWPTDIPKVGLQRRKWLLSKCVRLITARRYGCVSKADFLKAMAVLRARFYEMHAIGIGGPVQAVGTYEFSGIVIWAQTHVEEATEDYLKADYHHAHYGSTDPTDPFPDPKASDLFGDAGGHGVGDDDATEFYQHHSMTDAHLGERVGRYYLRDHFLASGRHSWHQWDGRRWAPATDTTVRRQVRDALMAIHAEETSKADAARTAAIEAASAEADASKAKSMADQATRAHTDKMRALASLFNVGKIDSVTKVSRGFVECKVTDFDQHPDLLAVGNGVIDLRTGELLPHNPELMLTKVTDVQYVAGARHEAWKKALEALPAEVREWMQVRFGQGASGHSPEDDAVPFLRGGGQNAKSTLLTGIMKALGEHCVLIPDKAILGSPSDHPTELMTLRGARLAFLEELPEGDYLDINRLKKITGSVCITARSIGEDNTTFEPTHSLMVTTNYAVQIKASDHGTWRRLVLVMFPYTFGGPNATHKGDPTLRPRIKDDPRVHEAVLAWIIEGARQWYANDRMMPSMPAAVANDTEAWQHSSNEAARFLSDYLELKPGWCVLTNEVYVAFKEWQTHNGRRVVSDQTFWERASGHQWLASGGVAKTKVRTSAWNVSRRISHSLGTPALVLVPAQARVLTGVRWKTDHAEPEASGPHQGKLEM